MSFQSLSLDTQRAYHMINCNNRNVTLNVTLCFTKWTESHRLMGNWINSWIDGTDSWCQHTVHECVWSRWGLESTWADHCIFSGLDILMPLTKYSLSQWGGRWWWGGAHRSLEDGMETQKAKERNVCVREEEKKGKEGGERLKSLALAAEVTRGQRKRQERGNLSAVIQRRLSSTMSKLIARCWMPNVCWQAGN